MSTLRLNITLPDDAARILAKVKNKSAYIADAVREKKRLEEKEIAKKQLESAYKEAANEDFETYKEWEDTLQDGLE